MALQCDVSTGQEIIDQINQNETDIQGKLSKSGGTMTGNLVLQNEVQIKAIYQGSEHELLRLGSGGTINFNEAQLPLSIEGNAFFTNAVKQNAPQGNDAAHLTRKDYVDNNFVKKSGDTLTGALKINTSNALYIGGDNVDPTSNTHIWYRDDQNINRAILYRNPINNFFIIATRDTDGQTPVTTLSIKANGNVSVNGSAPQNADELTRKDYVDTLVTQTILKVLYKFKDENLITQADIDEILDEI